MKSLLDQVQGSWGVYMNKTTACGKDERKESQTINKPSQAFSSFLSSHQVSVRPTVQLTLCPEDEEAGIYCLRRVSPCSHVAALQCTTWYSERNHVELKSSQRWVGPHTDRRSLIHTISLQLPLAFDLLPYFPIYTKYTWRYLNIAAVWFNDFNQRVGIYLIILRKWTIFWIIIFE